MSILAGCHEARNNFVLKEIACPECGDYIELFVRDGKTTGIEKCASCHYVIGEGLGLSEIFRGQHGA
ncbi:hypothetical protein GH811_12365 [Acetobacterium malicum]|uniref:Uncharacterized protein n=1 Tax=Acetobacterium malicum TaxID=52692 RepID=A0ABR6YYU6_9FIRM|nr:hypothetical protein [Acetobacterium malicum]MBC3900413.1 hypothetical protein [Acetobacterium malicum]